jgi:hypothetical protein
MTDNEMILTQAIKALSIQLNDLLKDCTDEQGKLKAPSRTVYMQSRACLPGQYSMTLKKEKK